MKTTKGTWKILFFFAAFFMSSSAKSATHSQWNHIQDVVIRGDLTEDKNLKRELAKKALNLANDCLKKETTNASCYYYRGQAKGLLAEGKMLGYPSRVRSMLQDWEKARQLDPAIDHGGPDRMFAEVYIDLPSYFGPKDLRKDLKKAIQHLDQAIQFSNYPTNFLDRATALVQEKRFAEAKESLASAKALLPEWQDHPYASDWEESVHQLEKKLR